MSATKRHKAKATKESKESTHAREKGNKFLGIFASQRQAQTILILVLILVSMFFSAYFRSFPANLPIAETWADNSIRSSLRTQILATVNQQNPYLPQAQKDALVNEQIDSIIQNQKQDYNDQVALQASLIRDQLQNDDGQTYLLAIDPYYYMRNVDNVLDHGYGGDKIVNGVMIDDHKLAPIGVVLQRTHLHTRLSAIVIRLVHFFNPSEPAFNIFFWMPVLISALAVIPAFLIARKKTNIIGGFIAAMIVALHPVFLGRTAAGFSDTDAYNVFFPLLIFWLFLEAFDAKEKMWQYIFAGLTGLAVGLYAGFWQGWWYIFDFMLVAIIVYVAYLLIKGYVQRDRKTKFLGSIRNSAIIAGIIVVSSGNFVSLVLNFKLFISAPLQPLSATVIQNAAKANLWPNVFTTVAELNKASLSSIVSQIGGGAYFYLAALGILLTMTYFIKQNWRDVVVLGGGAFVYLILITKPILTGSPLLFLFLLLLPVIIGGVLSLYDTRKELDMKYAVFLVVWFAGTIYAATQGVRFILLLVPAYAVALGIFAGELYKILAHYVKDMDIEKVFIKAGFIVLLLLLLINPLSAAKNAALYEVPSMNDAWWDSLKAIETDSAPNAIINSWWDFGHWFKYVADRAVTFDGTTQNTPMAHWIGRVLVEDNEDASMGILRMLDCGSRTGFDQLTFELQGVDDVNKVKPETTLQAYALMDKLILLHTQEEANSYLEANAGLSSEAASRVTALTHCVPPEDYFITSTDMIGKAAVWGHFGLWDFKKAYVFNNLAKLAPDVAVPQIEELFSTDTKDARQIYFDAIGLQTQDEANAWISPWPNYITSRPASCVQTNGTVSCGLGRSIGTQNGYNLILESIVVPLDAVENATFVIGAYNPSTNQRSGETHSKPTSIVIGQNGSLTTYNMTNPGMAFSALLHEEDDGSYVAVVADPHLVDSLFTRLF